MNLEIRPVAGGRYMAFVVHADGHERPCNHRHETPMRALVCGRAWRNRLANEQSRGS